MDFKRFVIILADGARPDVLAHMLGKGELPSIARHLVERGGVWPAVTSFPSTTGPAYIPLLTGCWPGTANIPGIRWLDRKQYPRPLLSWRRRRSYIGPQSCLMGGDMRPGIRTLFEIFPRSINVFNIVHRGLPRRRNWGGLARLAYWYYAHLTDHWYLPDRRAGEFLRRLTQTDFDFAFLVFPAIDEYSHMISPFSLRTHQAYRELDRIVGEAVRALKEQGILDEICFFLTSDHGLSETHTHFPLNQFLERFGLRTLYYPKVVKWGVQAAGMVSGNAMGHIYLAKAKGWEERWTDEDLLKDPKRILARLIGEKAVDCVATRSAEGPVVVRSRRGEARLAEISSDSLAYEVKGNDPFGYPPLPLKMTFAEALDATQATEYPDAPVQLLQLFRSERTGDIVISAAPGHDLRLRYEIPEHRGSHGSLHREHMQIPLVTNAILRQAQDRLRVDGSTRLTMPTINPSTLLRAGPERSLPRAESRGRRVDLSPLRTVDVFSIILGLAGYEIPQGIDGRRWIGGDGLSQQSLPSGRSGGWAGTSRALGSGSV